MPKKQKPINPSPDELTIAENHFPFGYFVACPATNGFHIHAGWSIPEQRFINGGGTVFVGKSGYKEAEELGEQLRNELSKPN